MMTNQVEIDSKEPCTSLLLARALAVAAQIKEALAPCCARIEIAGSLRRRRSEVGDIEIVFIPRQTEIPDPANKGDLFGGGGKTIRVSAVDLVLEALIARGSVAKRTNVNGSFMWGPWNKLAVAVKTGIPVDFFATTEQAWWNYLVCRTGSAETNMRIASAAKAMGYMWHPTRYGFEQKFVSEPGKVRVFQVRSEQDVFSFVGLPYLEPELR